MGIEIWISIIIAGCAVLGLLLTYFGVIADLKEKIGKVSGFDFTDMLQRITKVEEGIKGVNFVQMSLDLAAMKVKTDLFWGAVEHVVRDLIKQPIHFRKDDLVDRFPNLTEEEMCELRDIITAEMKDLIKDKKDKVLAYALMKARIDQVLWDRNRICEDKSIGLGGKVGE